MELRVRQDQNCRTFALVSGTHVLLFRWINQTQQCAIELVAKPDFKASQFQRISLKKVQGFLGLIEMEDDVFLCVITQSFKCANPLDGEVVYKIVDVEFYSLTNAVWDFLDLNSNGFPNIDNEGSDQLDYTSRVPQHPCWELRKFLTDGSFFYSTDFDLTSTLQGRGSDIGHGMSMQSFHMDYMWNAFMMKGIINFKNNLDEREQNILDQDHFLTTVIRGFAESSDSILNGKRVRLTIISKQSWKRAGTRFNVRGVDDDGNVANFVETEVILNNGEQVYSFVEIRGSIPMFWEQDTALISPKVQITRSFEAAHPTFEKHFDHLKDKYSLIHIVNLLTDNKTSEAELTNAYVQHYKAMTSLHDSVFYTHFDFHQETKNTYADAIKVIPKLNKSLQSFDYFLYDIETKRVIQEQKGVFRTNCLDCLDRTNVIQQVISLAFLRNYLDQLGARGYENVENNHRTLWANHGDQISQIYTGTNALKSSFSRSGKMGFAGALSDATKSISRIYINNFVDKGKQQVTDTLLGKISSQKQVLIYDPIVDYLHKKLPQFESKFSTSERLTIFSGTFNLAGSSKNDNLSDWLFPRQGFTPDVFVIGFQEVVELNASNILKNDQSAGDYWKIQVENTLKVNAPNENYILLRFEYMSSILLMLLVKEKHVSKVTQVEGKSKKTGLGGMTANKGSVSIRANFGSTSMCFVCSHLAAGTSNYEERNSDFISSFNGIRFSRNRLIKNHDYIIWLGDLNYRISSENMTVRMKVQQEKFEELLKLDQLNHQMKRIPELKIFKELPIEFKPTYKLDKFSDEYDSSEKQRVPSWTDRIIYCGKGLESHVYDIANSIKFSDHRPVYNVFTAMIKIINKEIKDAYSDKLIKEFKSTISDQQNNIELNDGPGIAGEITPTAISSPSSSSIPSKRTSLPAKNLIDFDEPTPSLPPRRVPPAYNNTQVQSMLVPGLTPANVQQSINDSINQPAHNKENVSFNVPSLKRNATVGSNISVMTPTKSRSGTPTSASSPAPPPPPPRRPPVLPSRANTSSSISTTHIIQSNSANDSNGENPATPQKVIPNEHAERLVPIVPSKPKELNSISNWGVMAPTKKI